LERIKEHYIIAEKQGHELLGVFLQGSQNYGLEYEDSDVDSKAIILPSFEDICLNRKPVSETYVCNNDEHIDLKDIRLMFDCFRKQNINFVEILFTDHFVINQKYKKIWRKLRGAREQLVRYDIKKAIDCIVGMSMQKLKALKHPYPATLQKIEKFGYDPKQLHHIIRLNFFIKDYLRGLNYRDCLKSKYREYLLRVKKGEEYDLKRAEIIANETHEDTISFANFYKENNNFSKNNNIDLLLNSLLIDAFKINYDYCL
jgi:predicted nucleotidyltransferase